MTNFKNDIVSIFAHDIGAANHIFSWILDKELQAKEFKFCLEGPAKGAFQKLEISPKIYSLEEALINTSIVITGTGWGSDLEYNALNLANKKGLKTISVVDSWVSIESDKNRFIRNSAQELPNEVWTISSRIKIEIEKLYTSLKVVTMNNSYLNNQLKLISDVTVSNSSNILFLMEPRGKRFKDPETKGEFKAFEYFLKNINLITTKEDLKIVIKPHPSDYKGKYDTIKYDTRFNVSVDEKSELWELISWSNIVVGMESYAMEVALESGRKVYSCLSPDLEMVSLRDPRVVRLSNLENAGKFNTK